MTDPTWLAGGGWLRCFARRRRPRHRLVCLPHAGGAATFFRAWPAQLPDHLEMYAVQYPGREDRFTEPCVTDLHDLADQVTEALGTLRELPLSLFGHSMGAALAHETAQRLAQHGAAPAHLFVSGHPPPHHHQGGSVHRSDDSELVDELHRLGGTRPDALDDPELRAVVLPMLRADYQAIESYRPTSRSPVPCPITAFTAYDDPDVTVSQMREWSCYTTAGFELRAMSGGHFYLNAHLPELAREITARTCPYAWQELP